MNVTAHEQAIELGKSAPPITVAGMTIAGYPLSDWVLVLTAIYTAIQIYLLIRRQLKAKRISESDPRCAADCPVAKRARGEQ